MSKNNQIHQVVQETYAQIAKNSGHCCPPAMTSCCTAQPLKIDSTRLGYSSVELAELPTQVDLGLGCGHPLAAAALQSGEVVLDLGSGAGIDCFLASSTVGPHGYVIGVEMTPAMLHQAREAAEHQGYSNVEFRLGEIEHLPVADNSIDVIVSNCVINLSPDKAQVFREAFRVLKPNGRLALSDVVAYTELPSELFNDSGLYCSCIGGAVTATILRELLVKTGFTQVSITLQESSREFIKDWAPGRNVEDYVVSAIIEARKI